MYTKKMKSMPKEFHEAQSKMMAVAEKDPSIRIEHEEWKIKAFKECANKDNKH